MGCCLIELIGHIKRRRFGICIVIFLRTKKYWLGWCALSTLDTVGIDCEKKGKFTSNLLNYSRNHAWLRVVDQQFAKSGDEIGISTK
jgi:hypothetical protein